MKTNCIFLIFWLYSGIVYSQTWDSVDTGINGGVYSLAVYNQKLYTGGQFTIAGGISANNITRWDGTSWEALGTGTGGGGFVHAFALYDGYLIVGGLFSFANGIQTRSIAKWDGTNFSTIGPGSTGAGGPTTRVNCLTVYNNGLDAGGNFSIVDGINANRIAKWDGISWSPLGSGIYTDDFSYVRCMAVYDGVLYVGGNFGDAGNVSANNIAKWDGSSWSAIGDGINGAVFSLCVYNDELYAAGNFSSVNGIAASRIAKWDGSDWTEVGGGMNGSISYLYEFDSELYAGGSFTTAGGVTANYIAKWDGINWSALGVGVDSTVSALCAYNNQLYVGGLFSNAGGVQASRIARWTPEGIGINENGKKVEVAVFPNPFSAATTLTLNKEVINAVVSVYTIQGKEVRNIKFSEKNVILEKGDLAGGIYFYKIKSPNEVIATGKLIIQ